MYSLCPAETKNQWARDDPAFVVITSLLVAVAAAAYCVACAPRRYPDVTVSPMAKCQTRRPAWGRTARWQHALWRATNLFLPSGLGTRSFGAW